MNAKKKNKKKGNILLWLIPVILLFVTGFVFATMYDLQINTALYSPNNGFAIFWEAFMWFPVLIPIFMLGMLLITRPKPWRKMWHIPAGLAITLASTAFACYYTFDKLSDRQWVSGLNDFATWAVMGTIVIIVAALTWRTASISPHNYIKYFFFSCAGTVLSIATVVATYGAKLLFDRTRFDTMMLEGTAEQFAKFTPWYQIFGNGGSSMPSGHTAHFACIIVLIILTDLFPQWEQRRKGTYIFAWLSTILMAFMRIFIGRHFLSDTLVAFGIVLVIFFIIRRTPIYKTQLDLALKASRKVKKSYY